MGLRSTCSSSILAISLWLIYSDDLVIQGFIGKLYAVFVIFIHSESAHDSP
jgi:hypothetical protein